MYKNISSEVKKEFCYKGLLFHKVCILQSIYKQTWLPAVYKTTGMCNVIADTAVPLKIKMDFLVFPLFYEQRNVLYLEIESAEKYTRAYAYCRKRVDFQWITPPGKCI